MRNRYFSQSRVLLAPLALMLLISGCQLSQEATSSSHFLVYSARETNGRSLYISDEEGTYSLKVMDATPSDGYPAASPDGKQIAFYGKYDNYKTWSIHRVNVDGTDMQRLTHKKLVWDSAPSWSADGKTIMFSREYEDANGEWREEIWLMNADGSEQRQVEALEGRAASFTPDGRILFQSKTGPSQIFLADIDGGNLLQLTKNDANARSPKMSPDGSQIAFLSNRDGNQELYTMNADGTNQRRITFNEVEDWDPAWSGDGTRLYFVSDNGDRFYDVYTVNKDGSSLRKVLDDGSQVSSARHLSRKYLERLVDANSQERKEVSGR